MYALRQFLRAATRDEHCRVDTVFSRFDLGTRSGYSAFLIAQARVLPPLEAALDAARIWRGWSPRAPALFADLCSLGLGRPAAIPLENWRRPAELWGALYVVEGARLGGRILARRVRADLPTRYLNDGDDSRWTRFQTALDRAPELTRSTAQAELLSGARKAFSAFETAGLSTLGDLTPRREGMPA